MKLTELFLREHSEKGRQKLILLVVLLAVAVVVTCLTFLTVRVKKEFKFKDSYETVLSNPEVQKAANLNAGWVARTEAEIKDAKRNESRIYNNIIISLLALLALAISIYLYGLKSFKLKEVALQQTSLLANRMTREPEDYFEELVSINLDNLGAYYVMVKIHTDNSFKTASAVGVGGFVLIALGVAVLLTDSSVKVEVATLAGISGVLVEFISAVQFWMYSKTVQQLKDYHDSLIKVQNILLSIKLVNLSSSPQDKDAMLVKIVDCLVSKTENGKDPGITTDGN